MSAFSLAINKILTVFFAVILIPFSVLTHGIDLISEGDRTDYAKTNVVGIGAYFRSQGMTSDGETLYFSSKTTLIRTESDAKELINANYFAIPDELKDLGIKHIGGLSFYNGKIYAVNAENRGLRICIELNKAAKKYKFRKTGDA